MDGFHDSCLVGWLRSKTDPSPRCEVCGALFGGVARQQKVAQLRPGLYFAYATGGAQWVAAVVFLAVLCPLPSSHFGCRARWQTDRVGLRVCESADRIAAMGFRLTYWWLAFAWARRCYRAQLRRLPADWGVQVRCVTIVLSPAASGPTDWAHLRTWCGGVLAAARRIASAARCEMASREAAAARLGL
jgi:hypothetical protein